MKKLSDVSFSLFCCLAFFASDIAVASDDFFEVSENITCVAKGNKIRRGGGYSETDSIDSRVYIAVQSQDSKSESENGAYKLSWVGHFASDSLWTPPNGKLQVSLDYYGIFRGKNVDSYFSSRANVYPAKSFIRIKDFNAHTTTSHDGGNIYGSFIIEKAGLEANNKEKFKAHYTVKSGDHFGGTVDYECLKK